jgi:ribose transport system ATP-binding protein
VAEHRGADRPLLEAEGLHKAFAGTRALRGVDLRLRPGEIHALVGQNGSGKSTLIKILSGFHAPDAGSLRIAGEEVHLPVDPRAAAQAGLRFVHQNPGLSPSLSVLETVRLQTFRTTWYGRVRWRDERQTVERLLASLGMDVDPQATIAELSPAQRGLVAIARAMQDLGDRPAILILDEPTATLGQSEVERLFATLRQLRDAGHAVLFVSHRLDEVLAIADRISVIRDGKLVWSRPAAGTTEADLVSAILGRDLGELYPERHEAEGTPTLAGVDLQGPTVRGLSLSVSAGEIVGVTGLGGMGHDEVPYLLFGGLPLAGGHVEIQGRRLERLSPRSAIEAGMALLPADRERESGVGAASVAENVTIGRVADYFRGGWLRTGRERSDVGQLLDLFQVTPRDPDRPLATLSGGNQQKALLAKWLQRAPVALLLHEPTQGVDIGSRQQVFRLIRQAADQSTAVLIASAEYEDLANLCTRVLVMRRGRLARQLSGAALTVEGVIGACYASA